MQRQAARDISNDGQYQLLYDADRFRNADASVGRFLCGV